MPGSAQIRASGRPPRAGALRPAEAGRDGRGRCCGCRSLLVGSILLDPLGPRASQACGTGAADRRSAVRGALQQGSTRERREGQVAGQPTAVVPHRAPCFPREDGRSSRPLRGAELEVLDAERDGLGAPQRGVEPEPQQRGSRRPASVEVSIGSRRRATGLLRHGGLNTSSTSG